MAEPHREDQHMLEEGLTSASPRPVQDDEQKQGLLKGWEGDRGDLDDLEHGNGAAHESGLTTSRSQSWLSATRWKWLAIASAVFIALLLGFVYMRWNVTNDRDQSTEVSEGVQSNDYILNNDWDFQAPPQKRHYSWTVRDQEHNPDGIYRPMILVNNQFPGPLIEVNEDDTIVVEVTNHAVNATSIHWHGIYQRGTPHMDGTVGITQCPIAPGATFTYEFTVDNQSGTYWWHAHMGVQSSDGVHGPLIIHSRREKELQEIPYSTDRVVLLSDHYHDLSSALLWQYLAPDAENAEPVPLGGVINGRSIRNCNDFVDRRCDNTSSHVGQPRIDLAPNQRHRLRLINVGAFAEFQVQVDEHELAVTEVDGTDVHPINYHRVNINPAQRYSVIVDTSVMSAETFWFRARMITKCFASKPKHLEADVSAVVRYYDGPIRADETPQSRDWGEALKLQCKDMDTTQLVPVEAISAPPPDAFFYLQSNFEIGAWRLSRGFFNKTSWRPDARSPTLLRALDGLATSNTSFYPTSDDPVFINTRAFDVRRDLVVQTQGPQVLDFLVSNYDDGNHPLHLHGYKYYVLAQGHGHPDLTYLGAPPTLETMAPTYANLDLTNPLRRDTASVEAYGWTLIRVVADNPGAWAFHCHISWHSEAGLLMQLLSNTDELKKDVIPQANMDLCAAQGIEKGMGPDDDSYTGFGK